MKKIKASIISLLALSTISVSAIEAKDFNRNTVKLNLNNNHASEGLYYDTSDIDKMRENSYLSEDLINNTLENRLDYQFGERVRFLDKRALEIVRRSSSNDSEVYMRKTLNRTREMSSLVIEYLGDTKENNVRWLTNFYVSGFQLAKSVILEESTVEEYYNTSSITSLKFGQMHALRMWRNSTGLRNRTVKGLYLVKLVDYLLDDLISDLENRDYETSNMIKDALDTLQAKSYQNIVESLESGEEPSSVNLAKLRKEVYRLIRLINNNV